MKAEIVVAFAGNGGAFAAGHQIQGTVFLRVNKNRKGGALHMFE